MLADRSEIFGQRLRSRCLALTDLGPTASICRELHSQLGYSKCLNCRDDLLCRKSSWNPAFPASTPPPEKYCFTTDMDGRPDTAGAEFSVPNISGKAGKVV